MWHVIVKWNLLWTRETLGCVLPSPGTLTQQDKCLGSTIRILLAVREPWILKSQYLLAWWDPLQHAPMGPSVQKGRIGKPIPSYCGQTAEMEPGCSGWTPQPARGRTPGCSSRLSSKIRLRTGDLKGSVSCRQVATGPDLQKEEVIHLQAIGIGCQPLTEDISEMAGG